MRERDDDALVQRESGDRPSLVVDVRPERRAMFDAATRELEVRRARGPQEVCTR